MTAAEIEALGGYYGATPRPDDFESFWQARMAEADAVPLHYTDVGYGVHPEKQQQYRIMHEWIPYFRSLCMNWDKPGGTYGQWAMPDDPSYFDRFASYASLAPAIDQKVSPFVTDEEVRTAAKAAAGGRSPSAADQSGGVAVFLAHPRQITAQGRGHGGHFAAAHSLFPL